jgi:hypothetical protein
VLRENVPTFSAESRRARLNDLGPRAVVEIDFDFAETRDWMAWPAVPPLKHRSI